MKIKTIGNNREYDESQLTLHNYKEPLSPIEKGFGYYGTITATIDGMYIQCHLCGNLYKNLGSHIKNAHSMLGKEYKERFELAFMSALVSENYRIESKKRALKWWASLGAEEQERMKQKASENNSYKRTPQQLQQLETKNVRGTCPDQLLEKIKEVAESLGHTPSKKEFIGALRSQRYVHLIYKTFGSWTTAVDMAGYMPKEKNHGRGGYRHYEDEELLAYLAKFAEETGEIPSYSDFYRGLFPSLSVYQHRWGNLENARIAAGVYDILEARPTE